MTAKSAVARVSFVVALLLIIFPARTDPLFLESQSRENALPSFSEVDRDETSIPYKSIDFGRLQITTYANRRPSLSIPIGQEASFSIKASHSHVGIVLKIPFE